MGYFYLRLAFLGAAVPYAFLGQLAASGKYSFSDVKLEALANPVSSYLAAAVLVTILVSWVFIAAEGNRLKMKGLWLPFLATAVISVSCGLPLFLFLRQIHLDRTDALPAVREEEIPPPQPPPAKAAPLRGRPERR